MYALFDFKNREAFRSWLEKNHDQSNGIELYIYKKGFTDSGISYEDAVQVALCYGWIDSVVHSYNQEKFQQHFSPRRKSSNWSLSNIKRMKLLIDSNEMTEYGLKYFDISLLDNLDEMIIEDELFKSSAPDIPDFFKEILVKENSLELFSNLTAAVQRRYIDYILASKKDETSIRRCNKIVKMLNSEEPYL